MEFVTDNQLMLQVRDGDIDKLGHLFERHHEKLYNFFLHLSINRDVSEDLVQEVFLRILKYRHTYRGTGKFQTWMYQIARNARIDHFRKIKNQAPLNDEIEIPMSEDNDPSENLQEKQEVINLHKALDQLSEDKKEILLLSRFQNMKYEEIAKIQNCKVGTIKAKVHRAMKELKIIYANLTE